MAERQFLDMDKSIRNWLEKKLLQLEREDLQSRHLRRGSPYFVEEVGQFRIVFKVREDLKQKRIVFVGDHKAYEQWYREQDTI